MQALNTHHATPYPEDYRAILQSSFDTVVRSS
jgi:hypothetical protein